MELSPDDIARFWSRVDTSAGLNECWPWTGALSGQGAKLGRGYGQMSVRGRLVRCTHIALWLTHGITVERGQSVLHSCDHPPCVNSRHLSVGDDSRNQRESVERGFHGGTRKIMCPQGHLYRGENLYVAPRGDRQCRTCMRAAKKRWRAKTGRR